MKFATSAFALSMFGLAACGAIAASASIPFAAMTVAASDPDQTIRNERERALRTASAESLAFDQGRAR